MMKKEWYIFQGTHHKGPFNKNDLLEFFLNGSIKRETLLWREEENSWEPLHKISELKSILENSPNESLTPQINDLAAPEFQLPEFSEEAEDDDLPPPLPAMPATQKAKVNQSMQKRQLAKMPEHFKDPTRLDLPPVPELLEILNQDQKTRFSLSRFKWIFALVVVLVISYIAYLGMKNFSSVPRSLYIRGLNPQNLERLEEIVQRPVETLEGLEKISVDFALTVDGKELWLASNLKDTALLQVTLNSKSNRVLGAEEIIIESRARLMDYQARFQKIRLLKGNNFLPGEYIFKVKGKKLFWLNNFFPSLQRVTFFNLLNKDFSIEGETIIYSGSKTDFEYRLIEYRKELIDTILRPYEEKIEKVNTLKGLVQKTFDSLTLILSKKNPQKEMAEFEAFFIKEISPILQNIVNDSAILAQTDIVEAAKVFGESATDIIQYVKTKTKWNTQNTNESDKALKRLKAQVFYLEMQLKKIEADMKKIRENP